MNPRPPVPPFTEETARRKVQAAEDSWNSRDPERVSLAFSEDTEWRNRSEFLNGRAQVVEFLRKDFDEVFRRYTPRKEAKAMLEELTASAEPPGAVSPGPAVGEGK